MNKTFILFYLSGNNVLQYMKINAIDSTQAKHFWCLSYKSDGDSFIFVVTHKSFKADYSRYCLKIKKLCEATKYKFIVFYREKLSRSKYLNPSIEIVFIEANNVMIAKQIFKKKFNNKIVLKGKRCSSSSFTVLENGEEPFDIIGFDELKQCYDYAKSRGNKVLFATRIVGDFKIYFNSISLMTEEINYNNLDILKFL